MRIDPDTGPELTKLGLVAFLARAWGMRPGYVIAAYNDMTPVEVPGRGSALLAGLTAFIWKDEPDAPGIRWWMWATAASRAVPGSWFLVRWPDGTFDRHKFTASSAQPAVAVRTIVVSPFSRAAGAIYLGSFDANKAPAHGTAWVVRSSLADALSKVPWRAECSL